MFKEISHTADTGLEITSTSLEALFTEAALGWQFLVFEESEIKSSEQKKLHLEADELEDLLVQWLSELNFFCTAEFWVMSDIVSLKIEQQGNLYLLHAKITGEPLDHKRHEIGFEIKAVTYHQLKITKKNAKYRTRIIFDI